MKLKKSIKSKIKQAVKQRECNKKLRIGLYEFQIAQPNGETKVKYTTERTVALKWLYENEGKHNTELFYYAPCDFALVGSTFKELDDAGLLVGYTVGDLDHNRVSIDIGDNIQ